MSKRTPKRSSVARTSSSISSTPRRPSASRSSGSIPSAAIRSRQLDDVLAPVAVLGRLLARHAGGDRVGEAVDLGAGVVDVVLALDLVADRLQQAHQRVAVGGVAAAADVQRAGRVGGDELDQDPLRRLDRGRAEVVAGGDQGGQRAPVPGVGEEEVDEAGAGDLDPLEAAGAAEVPLQLGLRGARRRRAGCRPAAPPAASPRWSCSRRARASAGGRARARARCARRRAGPAPRPRRRRAARRSNRWRSPAQSYGPGPAQGTLAACA